MKLSNQKAINVVRRIRKEWHFDKHEHYEALQMSINALEKRTPINPIEIDHDCNYFVCPSCGESIYSSEHLETHKFCLMCGQAIDWTDTE